MTEKLFTGTLNHNQNKKNLSDDNQADIIEAFNSTSKYQDELLNINNRLLLGPTGFDWWFYFTSGFQRQLLTSQGSLAATQHVISIESFDSPYYFS